MFEKDVFPRLKEVTGGGTYDGYTVVIQGDQAGFPQRGRFREIYAVVLLRDGMVFRATIDAVAPFKQFGPSCFPSVVEEDIPLAEQNGLRLLRPQEIWETSLQTWAALPSCKIARALVLAYRLAKKVVEEGGDNNFLRGKGSKGLHSGISKDFYDTNTGIERKDG